MTTQVAEPIEIETDNRGRIALGKIATHTRYRVEANSLGEITLTPLVSIPVREMILLERPDLRAQLEQAIGESERGEGVDLGSFAQYLNDDED